MSNIKITIFGYAVRNGTNKHLELDYSTVDEDELTVRIYPDNSKMDQFESILVTEDDIDDLATFLNHMRRKKVNL